MSNAQRSRDSRIASRLFVIVAASGDIASVPRDEPKPWSTKDWAQLLQLAVNNGVASYLHAYISQQRGQGESAEVLFAQLRERAHLSTYRSLALRAELVRVLKVFRAEGIAVIPLKGPYMADRYYAQPSLREFGDLDLLVDEADRDRAWQLLLENGYHSPYQNHDLEHRYHVVFKHKQTDEMVELHWRIAGPQFGPYYRGGFLWDGATERVYRSGLAVLEPRVEANLLYLAIHAYKHDWSRLQWLLDFPEMIGRASDLDWDRLDALAHQQHAHKILRATLQLVRNLFPEAPNAPQTHPLSRPALSPAQLRRIGRLLLSHSSDAQRLGNFYALRVAMAETSKDKLRLIVDSLRPSDRDHEFLPLPPLLRPFRFMVRPLRLVGRMILGRSRDEERRNH